MGCDPDAITCFLSTYEREILKDNVQPNSVLHVEIIIMKENNPPCVIFAIICYIIKFFYSILFS